MGSPPLSWLVVSLAEVDEASITRAVLRESLEELAELVESDVIIVGAGPSGLTAARYLAEAGLKTLVLERRLSIGGGMGGGGMLLPRVVVEKPADRILREVGCRLKPAEGNLYTVDVVELMVGLAHGALQAGARILLGITVEDVVFQGNPPAITGVVVQWSAVQVSGLHVDPLSLKARAIVDCTGHEAEVLSVASRKIPELNLTVPGEKSMSASTGERMVVEYTGEVAPGLYAAGMAVAAAFQTPRMGPIFGGMLLSGRKVANLIIKKLKGERVREK